MGKGKLGNYVDMKYILIGVAVISETVISIWRYGINMQALLVFLFLMLLTAISVVDVRTMEIPHRFVMVALLLGGLAVFIMPEVTFVNRLIGMVSVSLPLFLVTVVVPEAFGGGDIKLMAACGLLLGWKLSLLSLFIGIVTGGCYGGWLLWKKKKTGKEHFAFGPFLCVGMGLALLWGDQLLTWYSNLFVMIQ